MIKTAMNLHYWYYEEVNPNQNTKEVIPYQSPLEFLQMEGGFSSKMPAALPGSI